MKVKLGPNNSLVPLPTTLVGAMVDNKPNFITISDIGVTGSGSFVFVTMNKQHYTPHGLKEAGTFSVNIPTVDLVKETDYCGMFSGRRKDKSKLFETFYGTLGNAPMIRVCPINLECKLLQTVEVQNFNLFVGKVVEAYCDSEYIENDMIDFSKIQPIIFLMNDRTYWTLGNQFAKAWDAGKTLK